jgi:hypothetical protein
VSVRLLVWDGSLDHTPATASVVELEPGEVYVMDDAWYAVGIPAEEPRAG